MARKVQKVYVPFAEYEAAKKASEGAKSYRERERLLGVADALLGRVMPEVGMGCTEVLFSDRRAKTVVEVVSPDEIVVSENETKCLDWYAGTYEVLPQLREGRQTFTRRRNGWWVPKGQRYGRGCVLLTLAYQDHYIDPSF